MAPASIARVLLDSPLPQLDRLFDYRVPERLLPIARPGVRVIVPLRSAGRQAKGYLVEIVDENGYDGVLSELDDIVSAAPVLDPAVWRLIRRAADRAAGVASDLVRLAIPTRQVRVEKHWLARLAVEPTESATTVSAPASEGQRVATPEPAPARAVTVTGYAPTDLEGVLRLNGEPLAPLEALVPVLTHRRVALTAIPEPVEIGAGLWVPAAMRTLAELAAATLRSGRSAILSVPDYRDLNHLQAVLTTLVPGEAVARVDAGQPAADRYRAFLRTLEPRPVIVLGNRAAVLAPAAALGLIGVWDDGDSLHSEPHAPGIHTRDLALLRQEDSGCSLVIAAHARSTDVQRLIEVGWLVAVEPTPYRRRRLTPTAHQIGADPAAARARIPSSAWRAAAAALEQGPVLVQVARPGYAPRIACVECGETARCTRCRGPLGLPTAGSMASCQWCGSLAVDWSCDRCESTRWRTVGRGSARTADELGRAFPGARVVLSDGATPLQEAPAGRTLVVATRGAEPMVPGGYRAVLLLDGEGMLARESLRVVEDCVRWWMNAAALAAPGAPVLLVGVGGSVATALATGHPEHVAASELADRMTLRFPPAVRVAAVAGTPDAVATALRAVDGIEGVDTLGPVQLAEGRVRAIVRFDYSRGAEIAAILKAEIIRSATARAPSLPGRGPRRRVPAIRVRFDDSEPFDDLGAPPSERMGP